MLRSARSQHLRRSVAESARKQMTSVRNARDLDAWKVSMDLVELTYRLTAGFPDAERYALVSQMRRAAVSMPSNIAEGQGVRMTRWALRHIVTAIGSSWELDTQFAVALRLKYL